MANMELIDYMEKSLEKGRSKESIKRKLKYHGWPASEIDDAFRQIGKEKEPDIPKYEKPESIEGKHKASEHGEHTTRSDGGDREARDKYFRLNEDEKIIFETRPLKGYFWYMLIGSLLGLFMFFLFFFWVFIFSFFIFGQIPFLIITIAVIILAINIVLVRRKYKMRYYWISNQRIIIKRGMIGYSINSIPLERVSDVLISRSFMERIFGFGSLHVQTLAGQYTRRGRLGAEGNLQAIPEPEENQERIFSLIKRRRKEAHITI